MVSCLVTIGDSWTWGSDLSDADRLLKSWPVQLSQMLELPLINLGVESATNYNYKWKLLDWANQTQVTEPLVIVGVTSPYRYLWFDNQQQFFQPHPNYLFDAKTEQELGINAVGGYYGAQLVNPFTGKLQHAQKETHKNFVNYQLDDQGRNVEIDTVWELIYINSLIKTYLNGCAVFWSNLHNYRYHQHNFFSKTSAELNVVKDLQPILNLAEVKTGHPTLSQHTQIANTLYADIIKI